MNNMYVVLDEYEEVHHECGMSSVKKVCKQDTKMSFHLMWSLNHTITPCKKYNILIGFLSDRISVRSDKDPIRRSDKHP